MTYSVCVNRDLIAITKLGTLTVMRLMAPRNLSYGRLKASVS